MEEKGVRISDRICDRCGRPAAVRIDEEFFCEECYQLPGSCCPEFGADDLWEDKPTKTEAAKKDG